MDKEFIVKIANNFYIDKRVTERDADYLLSSYCEEFNKDSQKTVILIALLKQLGIIDNYISTALDYYISKYQINLILDKNNNIIKIY